MSLLDDIKLIWSYDPYTGLFTRLVRTGQRGKIGDVAKANQRGYVSVKAYGEIYLAHRLAWLYTYGKWPTKEIDHINRNRADNRIVNLREVTVSQNQHNTGMWASNTSGYKGIRKKKDPRYKIKVWECRVRIDGIEKFIGMFETAEEAKIARDEYIAKQKGK